ncbi:helix-turn-helix transcriptional regulator [Alkaliphilus transvaalensis]|uniref:helix-turn-helix transcriptional regulator n=1 Tax=Alkaliphilus transvaalensis TaxID=114628 RepID=UPI0004794F0B|nr:AraC family transcriptional regulator [Alkaliphilus transvaalensis]
MENWENINAVQRVQDYIVKHITEEITLHGLAQVAGYSPWYTSRIFKELVGKPPLEYIRALRLSHAALKLRDEKIKVVDVALEFAFNSHEGFTRAFSQQFGMTPKHYQKGTPPIPLFMPSSIREYYLIIKKGEVKKMEKTKNNIIFTQVVERPARKLILKRGIKADNYFDYCEEVGCDVWGILCSIKEALYEPIGMWLPENLRKKGTSVYAQGVEVPINYKGEVPAGFEIIELSPCKVMVFQGAPFNNEEFGDAIAELWEAMKEYNPELYGFKWADEDGPRFQLVPLGERGYIEARPVRSLKQD